MSELLQLYERPTSPHQSASFRKLLSTSSPEEDDGSQVSKTNAKVNSTNGKQEKISTSSHHYSTDASSAPTAMTSTPRQISPAVVDPMVHMRMLERSTSLSSILSTTMENADFSTDPTVRTLKESFGPVKKENYFVASGRRMVQLFKRLFASKTVEIIDPITLVEQHDDEIYSQDFADIESVHLGNRLENASSFVAAADYQTQFAPTKAITSPTGSISTASELESPTFDLPTPKSPPFMTPAQACSPNLKTVPSMMDESFSIMTAPPVPQMQSNTEKNEEIVAVQMEQHFESSSKLTQDLHGSSQECLSMSIQSILSSQRQSADVLRNKLADRRSSFGTVSNNVQVNMCMVPTDGTPSKEELYAQLRESCARMRQENLTVLTAILQRNGSSDQNSNVPFVPYHDSFEEEVKGAGISSSSSNNNKDRAERLSCANAQDPLSPSIEPNSQLNSALSAGQHEANALLDHHQEDSSKSTSPDRDEFDPYVNEFQTFMKDLSRIVPPYQHQRLDEIQDRMNQLLLLSPTSPRQVRSSKSVEQLRKSLEAVSLSSGKQSRSASQHNLNSTGINQKNSIVIDSGRVQRLCDRFQLLAQVASSKDSSVPREMDALLDELDRMLTNSGISNTSGREQTMRKSDSFVNATNVFANAKKTEIPELKPVSSPSMAKTSSVGRLAIPDSFAKSVEHALQSQLDNYVQSELKRRSAENLLSMPKSMPLSAPAVVDDNPVVDYSSFLGVPQIVLSEQSAVESHVDEERNCETVCESCIQQRRESLAAPNLPSSIPPVAMEDSLMVKKEADASALAPKSSDSVKTKKSISSQDAVDTTPSSELSLEETLRSKPRSPVINRKMSVSREEMTGTFYYLDEPISSVSKSTSHGNALMSSSGKSDNHLNSTPSRNASINDSSNSNSPATQKKPVSLRRQSSQSTLEKKLSNFTFVPLDSQESTFSAATPSTVNERRPSIVLNTNLQTNSRRASRAELGSNMRSMRQPSTEWPDIDAVISPTAQRNSAHDDEVLFTSMRKSASFNRKLSGQESNDAALALTTDVESLPSSNHAEKEQSWLMVEREEPPASMQQVQSPKIDEVDERHASNSMAEESIDQLSHLKSKFVRQLSSEELLKCVPMLAATGEIDQEAQQLILEQRLMEVVQENYNVCMKAHHGSKTALNLSMAELERLVKLTIREEVHLYGPDDVDPPFICLIPINDSSSLQWIPPSDRYRIGRFSAMLTAKSMVVSRHHAEIYYEDTVDSTLREFPSMTGCFVITDVGSSSGTFVNGRRLSDPNELGPVYILRNGDLIQFGVDYLAKKDAMGHLSVKYRSVQCMVVYGYRSKNTAPTLREVVDFVPLEDRNDALDNTVIIEHSIVEKTQTLNINESDKAAFDDAVLESPEVVEDVDESVFSQEMDTQWKPSDIKLQEYVAPHHMQEPIVIPSINETFASKAVSEVSSATNAMVPSNERIPSSTADQILGEQTVLSNHEENEADSAMVNEEATEGAVCEMKSKPNMEIHDSFSIAPHTNGQQTSFAEAKSEASTSVKSVSLAEREPVFPNSLSNRPMMGSLSSHPLFANLRSAAVSSGAVTLCSSNGTMTTPDRVNGSLNPTLRYLSNKSSKGSPKVGGVTAGSCSNMSQAIQQLREQRVKVVIGNLSNLLESSLRIPRCGAMSGTCNLRVYIEITGNHGEAVVYSNNYSSTDGPTSDDLYSYVSSFSKVAGNQQWTGQMADESRTDYASISAMAHSTATFQLKSHSDCISDSIGADEEDMNEDAVGRLTSMSSHKTVVAPNYGTIRDPLLEESMQENSSIPMNPIYSIVKDPTSSDARNYSFTLKAANIRGSQFLGEGMMDVRSSPSSSAQKKILAVFDGRLALPSNVHVRQFLLMSTIFTLSRNILNS